jgi:hypothetical protein
MGWGERANGRIGKVVVGYPAGGSVTLAFHASMLKLLGYELQKGERRLLSKINHTQGLYVADNRTLLAQQFLRTGVEWMLQIDTDIEFQPTLLEDMLRLAGSERKILAASVPLGGMPTCAFNRTDDPSVWETLPFVPTHPVACDAVATAVCLIHRDVFLQIADRHGQCWFHHMYIPKSAEGTPGRQFAFTSIGEDIAFSLRAAREGVPSWVVHVPGVKHHKTQALSHDGGLARMMRGDGGVGELVEEGA